MSKPKRITTFRPVNAFAACDKRGAISASVRREDAEFQFVGCAGEPDTGIVPCVIVSRSDWALARRTGRSERLPKPQLPRKPAPLRLPGIHGHVAEVMQRDQKIPPYVALIPTRLPYRLDAQDASRLSRWLARAHAYIAAVEARKEADRG